MAFDENNFAWLSFSNGLQKFDGEQFISIEPQDGLSEVTNLNFFKTKAGFLLFSFRKGISKYDVQTDKFIRVHTDENEWRIFLGETIHLIYFLSHDGWIRGIHNERFHIVDSFFTGLGNAGYENFTSNSGIINGTTAINFGGMAYVVDLHQHTIEKIVLPIRIQSGGSIHLLNEKKMVYSGYNGTPGVFGYDLESKHQKTIRLAPPSSQTFRSRVFDWQGNKIVSLFNEVYLADPSLTTFKHRLVNYKNQPLTRSSVIKDFVTDNFQNLYLLTLDNGFVKIAANNFPVRYFGAPESNNFVVSLFVEKEANRIWAGTNGEGLLVFDTLQRLVKHIRYQPGIKKSFTPSAIIKNGNHYILLLYGENKILVLDKEFRWQQPFQLSKARAQKINIDYFSKPIYQDQNRVIVQSGRAFIDLDLKKRIASQYDLPASASVLSAAFYRGLIAAHVNDTLHFIDTSRFEPIKSLPFRNTGGVRSYTVSSSGHLYLGANRGIFKTDFTGKVLQHYSKESGLPDDCVYDLNFDQSGNIWYSSNKGIIKVDKTGKIFHLTREDGLQENEFNTNVSQVTADDELYFGGVNGISSFYPQDINNFNEPMQVLFTDIRVNNEKADTALPAWNTRSLTLPHDHNYVSFDFIAISGSNPSQYIYQYRMAPIDKEWIKSGSFQTVRYQLPPGDYQFQVYAGKAFDKEASPMNQINVHIRFPYWQTWWFYTLICLGSVVVIGFGFYRYNHARYMKKLMVLENERRLGEERERISRDLHDNVGAYANAVLYHTELLEKEGSMNRQASIMKGLQFASKDIISSLRETIWALKKENYTAQDCFFRIKNFMQRVSRYYTHIDFKIQGVASAEKIISHQRALNIVRVVQEAVNNSIKHAGTNRIIITSQPEGDIWHLTIEDFGTGFSSIQHKEGVGDGLKNMEIRKRDGNFELEINSVPDVGTAIHIRVP